MEYLKERGETSTIDVLINCFGFKEEQITMGARTAVGRILAILPDWYRDKNKKGCSPFYTKISSKGW